MHNNIPTDLKIVFFGTPDFAVTTLDRLLQGGCRIAAVVSTPDRPERRGHKLVPSAVSQYALDHEIPLLRPEKLRDLVFQEELKCLNADLFIVVAFKMLPKSVWSMPRLGTFNVHASLLPAFRGAAPINHAIITGQSKTGVTTFLLDEQIDTGAILMRRETEITADDDAETLHDRLAEIGADLALETVRSLASGSVTPLPQNDTEATAAPKIFRENCLVDWERPAVDVFNLIRGLSPFPAAWGTVEFADGKRADVKILRTTVVEGKHGKTPGEIVIEGNRAFVATADTDRCIELLEVQPAGKRRMTAAQWLLGYKPVKFVGRDA